MFLLGCRLNWPGLGLFVLGHSATVFYPLAIVEFAMSHYATCLVRRIRFDSLCQFLARTVCLVALVGCLLSVGCAPAMNLRGPALAEDRVIDCSGKVREPDSHADFFGFSNKARQIEQRLGVE